jgi:hypothetical protein
MRVWSLRSPGAREAVHITLLSLLANLLFLGGSALLTKRFDAEEKMFALLSLADALGGLIVLARFASRHAGAESAATLALGALCIAIGGRACQHLLELSDRRAPRGGRRRDEPREVRDHAEDAQQPHDGEHERAGDRPGAVARDVADDAARLLIDFLAIGLGVLPDLVPFRDCRHFCCCLR